MLIQRRDVSTWRPRSKLLVERKEGQCGKIQKKTDQPFTTHPSTSAFCDRDGRAGHNLRDDRGGVCACVLDVRDDRTAVPDLVHVHIHALA